MDVLTILNCVIFVRTVVSFEGSLSFTCGSKVLRWHRLANFESRNVSLSFAATGGCDDQDSRLIGIAFRSTIVIMWDSRDSTTKTHHMVPACKIFIDFRR